MILARKSEGSSTVTFKKLESSMCKRRRILQPKLPTTALEFDQLLQESQHYSNHLQTVIDRDHIAIIFGSSCMINMLKSSTMIHFDGTFNVVPRLFYQLFTIFVHIDGHVLPAIHVLMKVNLKLYIMLYFYQFVNYFLILNLLSRLVILK